ncbi:hypothetical protein [Segatella baroniae]|uniref:hypothetical protein n=1 Tax=Segatella baroniae TaxID=305719 RepID=UPI0012DC4FAD|nr:hypothetical protein [Segatella baroniae]
MKAALWRCGSNPLAGRRQPFRSALFAFLPFTFLSFSLSLFVFFFLIFRFYDYLTSENADVSAVFLFLQHDGGLYPHGRHAVENKHLIINNLMVVSKYEANQNEFGLGRPLRRHDLGLLHQ